ncbi:MAG: MaoC family dehydratase [Janthinobacterium lividum]
MSQSNASPALYLEDLSVGMRFRSGEFALDTAQIKAFANAFDPQPFHLDDAVAAAHPVFNGLSASGWHTAAITMRLLTTGGLPLADGIIGAGAEITWPLPTRPGDALHVDSEIVDIKLSRSRPDRGIVSVRSETVNQHGDVVQRLVAKVLVRYRQAAGGAQDRLVP